MLMQGRLDRHVGFQPDGSAWVEGQARQLYARLCSQARWRRLWSTLGGRTHRLLDLASAEAICAVVDRRFAGRRAVPLSQIRGTASDGRCHDFDAGFGPLHAQDQARWIQVATARLRGARMPPVALIELGGIYFVTDGHHRVSVARALGEEAIEADVTTWQVVGSFP